MNEIHPCPECAHPLPQDAFVCRGCVDEARRQILNVAFFMTQADDKRARRSTTWKFGTVGRSPVDPLPFDPRVTGAIAPFVNALVTTARMAEDETGETWPASEIQLALWVRERALWASRQEWAVHFIREMRHGHARVVRAFDIPPDTYAIGKCLADLDDGSVCNEYLAAPAREGFHKCPKCGNQHDVAKRRAALLEQAASLTVTVQEAVRLLRLDGMSVDSRTLWAVVRHVPIQPAGDRPVRDIRGRTRQVSVYPLGKVREAVAALAGDREMQREVGRLKRGAA